MQPGRLGFLDALRGVAAAYVVVFHTALVPDPPLALPNYGMERLISFGGTGVILFFVISGFSLSMTMGRHERSPTPLLSYAASRIFRIVPLFYFMLVLTSLRDFAVWGDAVQPKQLLLNLSMLYNLFPGQQEGIVWASWTIGVEVFFYAAFPWIYRLSFKGRLVVLAAALAAFGGVLSFQGDAYARWTMFGHFPSFLIGMFAFDAYLRLRTSARAERWGVVILGVGLGLLASCAAVPDAELFIAMRAPIALAYALIVVGCGLCRPAILEGPVARFYGGISYSLYLMHPVVIVALFPVYPRIVAIFAPGWELLACAALTLTVATVAAAVTYRLIEKPGIALGKAVSRAVQPRLLARHA